jgi:REP element-mobilizing transposase RayT
MYSGAMSRLGRLVLSDRFFLLTVKLLPKRRLPDKSRFALLARCLSVVRARRQFRLAARVLLPDHWHVILFPRHPFTISDAMKSIKLSSINSLSRHRGEAGELWQGRFSTERCEPSRNTRRPRNTST